MEIKHFTSAEKSRLGDNYIDVVFTDNDKAKAGEIFGIIPNSDKENTAVQIWFN